MRVVPAVLACLGASVLAAAAPPELPGVTRSPAAQTAQATPVIFISPEGNDADCARGSQFMPCASFNRAYALALCGDIIEVAGGSYGKQVLTDTPRVCPSAPVTVQAQSGQQPQVLKIQLGSKTGAFSTDGPDDLTLAGFALVWGIQVWSDATNIVIEGIDGGSFLIGGGDRITIRNSTWGPCTPSGTFNGQFSGCRHYFERDPRSGQPRMFGAPRNVTIQNNRFHDMVSDLPGTHWECLWVAGGIDIAFRSNSFDNCSTNAIAMGDNKNDANIGGTWLFTNNWCGRVPASNGCFKFGQLPYDGTVIFKFNSFALNSSIEDEERGDAQGRVVITRNVLGRGRCVRGAVYTENYVLATNGCGSSDRLSIFGYHYDGQRLLIDSRSAQTVRAVFAQVGSKRFKSLSTVARALSRLKTLPRPPGGWNAASVKLLATDKVYLGRNLGITGRHPALVSRRDWLSAQRALALR